MKSTALAGYALAGWVLATALISGGLYAWLHVLTAQGDGRQFYVLVYLLYSPMVGGVIGIPLGLAYGRRRERARPGERPSVLQLRAATKVPPASHPEGSKGEREHGPVLDGPPVSKPTSLDGITLLVVALVPGLFSAILWWPDPAGTLKQVFSDVLAAVIFLSPVGTTVGLVAGGVDLLRKAR